MTIPPNKTTARRRSHPANTSRTILYRAGGFAGGGGTGKLWLDLLGRAFVGLVLVDMPLSLGKLPFASRMFVISWAKAGVAERKMNTRAALILIRACHWGAPFFTHLSDSFYFYGRRHERIDGRKGVTKWGQLKGRRHCRAAATGFAQLGLVLKCVRSTSPGRSKTDPNSDSCEVTNFGSSEGTGDRCQTDTGLIL
jgi:hypothetical protein